MKIICATDLLKKAAGRLDVSYAFETLKKQLTAKVVYEFHNSLYELLGPRRLDGLPRRLVSKNII